MCCILHPEQFLNCFCVSYSGDSDTSQDPVFSQSVKMKLKRKAERGLLKKESKTDFMCCDTHHVQRLSCVLVIFVIFIISKSIFIIVTFIICIIVYIIAIVFIIINVLSSLSSSLLSSFYHHYYHHYHHYFVIINVLSSLSMSSISMPSSFLLKISFVMFCKQIFETRTGYSF